MAKKPKPSVKLLCPRCGKSVARSHQDRGVQRYMHSGLIDRRNCNWSGSQPIGLEKDKAQGIPREHADALHKKLKAAKGVQRYLITSAQNATPVNKKFLAALLTYCKVRKAQLIVIPYRYKNPTAWWSKKAENDDWWAPELVPYLLDRRIVLNQNLMLLADIKVQPTSKTPLEGFETISGERSAIIGHPAIQLKTIPTPQAKMAKILTTTGAVTRQNYIPSKAGARGAFHHTFGAAAVEIVGKIFHLRQINAVRDGSFIDLNTEYLPSGKTRIVELDALIMGDSHVEFVDKLVAKATFEGSDSIIGFLKPKVVVWHDTYDFFSKSHHHRNEPFTNLVKFQSGMSNVENSLNEVYAFIDRVTRPGIQNIFVASNHPEALARWVKEADPRQDPENLLFWAKTFLAMGEGARRVSTGAVTIDPFSYWALKKLKTASQARFLSRGESYVRRGIELGYHFDRGPGGSKGSRVSYSRIGVKTIGGHSHSPGITAGAYQVGTSSLLDLEYNRGSPSSWLQTHCLIFRNGKRSLINIIDGEWKAP